MKRQCVESEARERERGKIFFLLHQGVLFFSFFSFFPISVHLERSVLFTEASRCEVAEGGKEKNEKHCKQLRRYSVAFLAQVIVALKHLVPASTETKQLVFSLPGDHVNQ